METENNSEQENEGKTDIKEEPFCMETTQFQIKSVLSNTPLQKAIVDVSSCLSEHDTHLKRESEINIKEEPWCVESTSAPGFESEETHLENGLVYVSCDSVTESQNKNDLDRAIKEEPLWKVGSTESKDGDLQDDMKDANSTVNERSSKLSTETPRSCTEIVNNGGTSTSTVSASADLQENSCLKMKEDRSYCKTSDFAVQLKNNSGMQENNELRAKVEIKEETWWLDRAFPVKSEPESTLCVDADVQSNTKDIVLRIEEKNQESLSTESSRARKPRRRWWVHPLNQRRIQQGDYHNLLKEMKDGDPQQFFHYMRLKPAQFDEILDMVAPLLQKKSNRAPLPPAMRLCITLRFLATGSSIPTLARSYRIGKSTCCQIINETTQVIWHALHQKYLPAPTECDYRRIAMEFKEMWNVPNCVGAIDSKHVAIQAPTNSGIHFNYKNSFSIVLMAVCDAKYCFTHVDIGAYGSQSEGGIFRNSQFGIKLLHGLLPLPPPTPLHPQGNPVPYHFLGDEAFPLGNNLMRPFAKPSLVNVKRKVFNFHQSRVRRVIENTLGILVARWQIFHRIINAKPENVGNIIRAAVCLHNYLRLSELHSSCKTYCPPSFVDRESNGVILEGEWRQNVPKQGAFKHLSTSHLRLGSRNASTHALSIRECISDYFISPAGVMNGQTGYVLGELRAVVSND